MHGHMVYRDTEQPQEKETSWNESRPNFLGGGFSNNRDKYVMEET